MRNAREQGIRNALSKAFKNYAQTRQHKKASIITPDDVMGRLSGVLSVFVREPEFQGQTKERLSSSDVVSYVEKAIKDRFESWLVQNRHRADFFRIYSRSCPRKVKKEKR